MKRFRLSLILSLLMLASQGMAYNSNWIGLQVGPVLSNSSAVPPTGSVQSSRMGIQGYIFYDYGLSDALFLRPEFGFRQGGINITDASGAKTLYAFDVIELPLLLILKFGSGHLNPYILCGPAPAYAIKKGAGLSSFDVGFHLGGGLEYLFSKDFGVFATTRLIAGLFDVVGSSGLNKFQNVTFSFTFGFQFRI